MADKPHGRVARWWATYRRWILILIAIYLVIILILILLAGGGPQRPFLYQVF